MNHQFQVILFVLAIFLIVTKGERLLRVIPMPKSFKIKLIKGANIVEPSQIIFKSLIFNEIEMHQLSLLKKLLQDANLIETQQRLTNKSLPQGVTILLHGSPGTGKTETVMQIAKETGRLIMKIEMSEVKSMYYGKNEKLAKGIFIDYKNLAKISNRLPILLFNEADAIFSKRTDIDNSSNGRMENAVQNILLDELENFNGILIATTNLTNNFDNAFDRRFLFKICFHKPDQPVIAKIWKLKLPILSDSECEKLANQYCFTGGQIDNIVRKNEIYEVIHGVSQSFDRIVGFCGEEEFRKGKTAVGFRQGSIKSSAYSGPTSSDDLPI